MAAETGCHYLGEFVDEGPPCPTAARGEVVRPSMVLGFIEPWAEDDEVRTFTVLLRDNREVTVRGHAMHRLGADAYSVVVHTPGGDVFVALFPAAEVTGIFSGVVRPPRESA